MTHQAEREALTRRTIPHMTLSRPSTHPAPPDSFYDAPADTAAGRFAVGGVAIVTGGTGTIGMTASRALLQHGLRGLMMFDLGAAGAGDKVDSLRREFPSAQIGALEVDVTDEERVEAAVRETVAAMGGVDALLCFAGIVGTSHALDTPIDQFRRIVDVNATASFIAARACARQMARQARGGRIVLTSSISAHRVNYPQPQAAYNASKAALMSLRMSLAAEWAKYGITVNSISPGYMDTILNEGDGLAEARRTWCDRNPMGRMGYPEELTGVVVMLVSRAGAYINGADIVVDGGGIVF